MEGELCSGNMQWVETEDSLDIGYSKDVKGSLINMLKM